MEIRKYIPSDKPKLRYICKQTAEGIFKHSEKTLEAAAIIYNDYFTENESDNIFVLADDNDNAVGYSKSVHLLIRLQHSFAVVDNLTDLLLNVLKVFCRLFIVNSISELY